MVRIGLDFLAQLVDENTQVLGLLAVIRTPDRLEQTPVAESLSLIRDEMT